MLQLLVNLTRLDLRKCAGLPVTSWQKHHDTSEKVATRLHTLVKKYPLQGFGRDTTRRCAGASVFYAHPPLES